jgi:hypothetical protein
MGTTVDDYGSRQEHRKDSGNVEEYRYTDKKEKKIFLIYKEIQN